MAVPIIVELWDSNTNVTDQCIPQHDWDVKLRFIFWMMTLMYWEIDCMIRNTQCMQCIR